MPRPPPEPETALESEAVEPHMESFTLRTSARNEEQPLALIVDKCRSRLSHFCGKTRLYWNVETTIHAVLSQKSQSRWCIGGGGRGGGVFKEELH